MLFKKSALVLAASLLAMSGAQAVLPNATANLSVTITASSSNASTSCSLSNGSFAPGVSAPSVTASYTSGSTTAVTGFGNLRVQCNGNDLIPFIVSAGAGNHSNGTSRRASANAGVDFINYRLETFGNPMLSPIWDDAIAPAFGGAAVSGTTSLTGAFPTPATTSSANIGFNLVVPAGQTTPEGTYTDVVLLTATF